MSSPLLLKGDNLDAFETLKRQIRTCEAFAALAPAFTRFVLLDTVMTLPVRLVVDFRTDQAFTTRQRALRATVG